MSNIGSAVNKIFSTNRQTNTHSVPWILKVRCMYVQPFLQEKLHLYSVKPKCKWLILNFPLKFISCKMSFYSILTKSFLFCLHSEIPSAKLNLVLSNLQRIFSRSLSYPLSLEFAKNLILPKREGWQITLQDHRDKGY